MNKQKKFRIVADMDSLFSVEEMLSGIWCKRFIAGKGKAGLELAEEWLSNQKMSNHD